MKKENVIILLIIVNIILLAIICNLITNNELKHTTQKVKEMSESTREEELNNALTQLNLSSTEYAKQVQESKVKIATAITNAGIETNANETADIMATNIENILKEVTKDATATEKDISEGKTAWVNGNLINGTFVKELSKLKVSTLSAGIWTDTRTITIPEGVTEGILIALLGQYDASSYATGTINLSNTAGIETKSTIYSKDAQAYNAGYRINIYQCKLIPGNKISMNINKSSSSTNTNQGTTLLLLLSEN